MRATVARPLFHKAMIRAAQHLVPLKVTVELTYRCNLSCFHCYVDQRRSDELRFEDWVRIFDQLAAAGTLQLLLTGGEIFTRHDFFAIASEARARGFQLLMLTNGTLLTPDMAAEIAVLRPLIVSMSLYGANAATHDLVTGRDGSFANTIRSAALLRDYGVTIRLQTLLMDANVHEAAEMRELASRLGVWLRIGHGLIPTKSGECWPQCHEAPYDQLARHVEPGWMGWDKPGSTVVGQCKAGRAICSIAPNGDVFPCALVPLKLGNLRETSFTDLWQRRPSSALQRLRQITPADFQRCQGCDLVAYCERCMGVALSETGSLTDPSPSACRYAEQRRALRAKETANV